MQKLHPYVSVIKPPKPGWPWQLYFKHPLRSKQQIKRSVRNTDGAQAVKYAVELSGIILNPDCWRNLPDGTSEIVKSLWQGDEINQAIDETVLQLTKPPYPFTGKPLGEDEELCEVMTPAGAVTVVVPKVQDYGNLDRRVVEQLQRLLDENKKLKADNAVQRAKADALAGLLRKVGYEAGAEYSPKPVQQAINDYLSEDKRLSGTNCGPRYKRVLKCWLDRFAEKSLPAAARVGEVTAAQVIDHLTALANGEYGGGVKPKAITIKVTAMVLNAWLVHQTKGMFKSQPVKEWIKRNCNSDHGEAQETPYWLEQQDVNRLLKNLPPYWRAVAMVQWAGGFRPEELAFLQRGKVTMEKDIRIEVDALRDGAKVIWKPKTRTSYGRVHLPEFSRKTVTRLVAGTGLL